MSQRDAGILILDMLEAAQRAVAYVEGLSEEEFLSDQKTKDAGVRNI